MSSRLQMPFSSKKDPENAISKLPYEILVHVFSFIDTETKVFSCRQVCKYWHDVMENEFLRKQKRKSKIQPISWFRYYGCKTNPIGKKLLLHKFGKPGFQDCDVTENGGEMRNIEVPFTGSEPLPGEPLLEDAVEDDACVATYYGNCLKNQIIRLKDFDISSKLMDELRPIVEVSEWFAPRFTCASYYRMTVELLDSDREVVQSKTFSVNMVQWTRAFWTKAALVFEDYEKGVRFIRFEHKGNDLVSSAGHYGPKMTKPSVSFTNASITY